MNRKGGTFQIIYFVYFKIKRLTYVMSYNFKIRVRRKMLYVIFGACKEIISTNDFIPFI